MMRIAGGGFALITKATHASVKVLGRIASALKVSMAALFPRKSREGSTLEPNAEAAAVRFKFDVRLLFPSNEPFAMPLARLMMATDDVRHLQRLLIVARNDQSAATPSDRAVLDAEVGHLFRLMCGHLFEAIGAFAAIDDKCRELLDVATSDARAKDALDRTRRARQTLLSKKGKRSLIHVARNLVGFHYPDDQLLRRTLDKHEWAGHLEGTLVLSPFQGLGRYTVADQITMFLIADEMGGDPKDFPQKYAEAIGDAIDLAGALAHFPQFEAKMSASSRCTP
jgi:hypothetical protein